MQMNVYDTEIYRVTFFGHRQMEIYDFESKLFPILKELFDSRKYIEFYIGRNGEFDIAVASSVKKLQNRFGKDNSELILVLPYPVSDLPYYEKYYDFITIPETIGNAHPKAALTLRNRWMVDMADLVVTHVVHQSGGAYRAKLYAEKSNKKIINIL